jgi:hypothetical protein
MFGGSGRFCYVCGAGMVVGWWDPYGELRGVRKNLTSHGEMRIRALLLTGQSALFLEYKKEYTHLRTDDRMPVTIFQRVDSNRGTLTYSI